MCVPLRGRGVAGRRVYFRAQILDFRGGEADRVVPEEHIHQWSGSRRGRRTGASAVAACSRARHCLQCAGPPLPFGRGAVQDGRGSDQRHSSRRAGRARSAVGQHSRGEHSNVLGVAPQNYAMEIDRGHLRSSHGRFAPIEAGDGESINGAAGIDDRVALTQTRAGRETVGITKFVIQRTQEFAGHDRSLCGERLWS